VLFVAGWSGCVGRGGKCCMARFCLAGMDEALKDGFVRMSELVS
jgi:hypothetical protein